MLWSNMYCTVNSMNVAADLICYSHIETVYTKNLVHLAECEAVFKPRLGLKPGCVQALNNLISIILISHKIRKRHSFDIWNEEDIRKN